MELSTLIGYTAGALGVASFIPQVIQSWRTKSLKDLSWGWIILFTTATMLWIIYGILLSAPPIIATNVSILALEIVLIYIKIKYK
jgi:MtN3 and saliva related transmembrane protein